MAKIILAVYTVEPPFNKPLYNKVLGKRNNFPYSRNSKINYMKKKLNIQPNLSIVNKFTNFASLLALHYFEVPLYMFISLCLFSVLGIQLMKTEQ